ncbi:carbonic anhydrase 2-like [Cynara cardunculus var. scolymus]|uniref:Carbonic anhydrase n=1 Tax=Cynara cardunculus var. scolymus TaxID=59895 RepID=A0A103YC23_CYNCS|nr:carbonic anhydrase 2-like [Cynara cardunculus var. scolymus]KVI06337.1 Carbonic anhydrase [Cynara cardunculus var. scolymus]
MADYSNNEVIASTETLRIEEEAENTNDTSLEKPPFDPIKRINEGFRVFKTNEFNKFPDYYRQLAEKQEPKFLIFACSDSRVSPTNILNLRPGEAFMARNIANLVPAPNKLRYSGTGAIIEYAVLALKVEVIVVIGHSRCGGINRLLSLPNEEASYDFIDDWVSIAQPAKKKVIAKNPGVTGEVLQTLVEKESVMDSLANLQSYSYVKSGVAAKKLQLIGGYYDFVRGNFEFLKVGSNIEPVSDI